MAYGRWLMVGGLWSEVVVNGESFFQGSSLKSQVSSLRLSVSVPLFTHAVKSRNFGSSGFPRANGTIQRYQ